MYVLNHIELCVKYLYIQKMSERKDTCGPIYHIKCKVKGDQQCKHDYIGETERTLKARFLEHRRPSSTSSEVSNQINLDSPGHSVSLNSVSILDRESSWFARGVKEAVYIRAHKPTRNRDGGRYNLSQIWDSQLAHLTQKCANP